MFSWDHILYHVLSLIIFILCFSPPHYERKTSYKPSKEVKQALFCLSVVSVSYTTYPLRAVGELKPKEVNQTPCTGCQSIPLLTYRDNQTFMCKFTPTISELPINLHVYGLWEEAGAPGGNPHIYSLDMQTSLHHCAANIVVVYAWNL